MGTESDTSSVCTRCIFSRLFVVNLKYVFFCSFLSPEVDSWFRRIVVDNRTSRQKAEIEHEDLMQMMLTLAKKHSKIYLEPNQKHFFLFHEIE